MKHVPLAILFSFVAAIIIAGGINLWANWYESTHDLTTGESTTGQEQVLPEDAEHLAAIQYLVDLAESSDTDLEKSLAEVDFYAEGSFEELARRFFCPDDESVCEALESGQLDPDALAGLLTYVRIKDICPMISDDEVIITAHKDGTTSTISSVDCDQQ